MKFPWPRKRREQQLDEELHSHLELSTRDLIDRGAPPGEAARVARQEFGNVALVQSVTRDQWSWTWLDNPSKISDSLSAPSEKIPASPPSPSSRSPSASAQTPRSSRSSTP